MITVEHAQKLPKINKFGIPICCFEQKKVDSLFKNLVAIQPYF